MKSKTWPRLRLGVEALECRDCPSITTLVTDHGHTLRIQGSKQAEHVWLAQNDDSDQLQLYWSSSDDGVHTMLVQSQTFQSSAIRRIVIDLRGGNDALDYTLEGNSGLRYAKALNVNLGAGNDAATFDFAGPGVTWPPTRTGDDTLVYVGETTPGLPVLANLKIALAAGSGDDQVSCAFGQVAVGVQAAFLADLGTGNDSASAVLYGGIASGAALNVALLGGTGNDSLTTDTGGQARIEVGGAMNLILDGQQGDDLISHYFGGTISGQLSAKLAGGQGADSMSAKTVASWDSSGKIGTTVNGGIGDDRLTVLTTVTPPPPEIVFILPWTPGLKSRQAVDGGQGMDSAEISQGVGVLRCESLTVRAADFAFGR